MLKEYEIKILEWQLEDYQDWFDNVKNCGNFPDPDAILQNKIKNSFERMKIANSKLDFASKTDEEVVNLIISQEGYKNRVEREEDSESQFNLLNY